MKTTEITKSESNGSVYLHTTFQVSGNTFSVLQVTGKVNYVSIRKETNNPFKTLGKQFQTWGDAAKHYKSPAMQIALVMAETSFKEHSSMAAPALHLENKPVTKSTLTALIEFVYNNRAALSDDLLLFYSDVKSILEYQLRKPAERRLRMNEILERAYNIEKYILAAGAISFQQEIIRLTQNN